MKTRPYPLDLSDAISAHTDGSSVEGNPGHAGFAVKFDDRVESDYIGIATNNVAEIYAIWWAIMCVPDESTLVIHTDSKLALCMIVGVWTPRSEMMQAWIEMIRVTLVEKRVWLALKKVKGHSGDPANEVVDRVSRFMAMKGAAAASKPTP